MSSFKASSGGSKINREEWGRPDLVAVHVERAWDLGDSKLFMSSDGYKSWGNIRVEQQLE